MMHSAFDLSERLTLARRAAKLQKSGKVTRVVGILAEAHAENVAVGDLCGIETPKGTIPAEVAGFSGSKALLMPLGELRGVAAGSPVVRLGSAAAVPVGAAFLGRVIDGFGRPIDGKPSPSNTAIGDLRAPALNPMLRQTVKDPAFLGIRVLDGLLTCGQGQRLGIVAGAGVGKTVLLSMIARRAACDVLVLALVGERGREVADFVSKLQKTEAFARTVVVCATSDRPPIERLQSALMATAMAEHFRDQGKKVVLVMDSLTRVAMAQREIGLAVGEPPTTKGYPPSVFALLPSLLERAGAKQGGGSITGIYTVLMEGDDMADPIADAAIAVLDGQIVLSRELAGKGHFPAVNLLRSVSRVMPDIVDPNHQKNAQRIRHLLGLINDNEDLVNIGAYVAGKNPELDIALSIKDEMLSFLKQGADEFTPPGETLHWMGKLANRIGGQA